LVGVGTQDFLGEAAAPRAEADGLGRSAASGEVQRGHVEVDCGADQFGEDRGEVHVQEQTSGSR
jgi:hypothetical protein